MDYTKFINVVSNKYGYSNDLKRAIAITIPLMVEKFGANRLDEILSVFSDIPIYTIQNLTNEEYDRIEQEVTKDINKHVKQGEGANYGNDRLPGSAYNYTPIYDENMEVMGEARWIVVQEMKGVQKAGYERLFGTSINMPYFIHEATHAFAMQKATYRKEENKIYSKHGMYETVDEIIYEDDGIREVSIQQDNLLVEELVNEKATQDMLVSFFQVEDYRQVRERLQGINHVSSNYGATLMSLAEGLELRIGTENLLKWRLDNDMSIKDNFNAIASNTEIATTYFDGYEPYAYFANKAHEIFLNNCNSYKMPLEEYKKKSAIGFVEAMAPICAYCEGIGEKDFAFYADARRSLLPEEQRLDSDTTKKAM